MDHVARVMQQWRTERPDLDPSPQAVVARLHRVGARLTQQLTAVYAEFGLDEGEFDILATLRRNGPDYALTPSELAAQTMVTSGAISKQVSRLQQRGLVHREVRAEDARGRLVTLSKAGRQLIDEAFEAHLSNEHALLAWLDDADRHDLAELLRRWAEHLDV